MTETTSTPPFGVDERGQPIEEVITTASRIRDDRWLALLAGLGIGWVAYELLEGLRTQRRRARR